MTLAGYQVPGRVPNTMTLNFEGGADDIPTFSFADLRACALKNDKDYFRRWFDGKVVIFGTVLDIEDRRMTSKRFATGIEGARAPRCAAESTPVIAGSRISTIAGVYIHATAVNNLIARNAVVEPGRWHLPDRGPDRGVRSGRRVAVRPLIASLVWTAMIVARRGRRHRRLQPRAGAARSPSRSWRACAALGRHDRLPLRRRRQGPPPAAEEFCALSRPARHQPHAVVEQAARTRRRNPQRDGVLLRHRGVFADRRKDVARRPDGADERISFGDDRRHREPWRICRQIYRRLHRGGVRRAGR